MLLVLSSFFSLTRQLDTKCFEFCYWFPFLALVKFIFVFSLKINKLYLYYHEILTFSLSSWSFFFLNVCLFNLNFALHMLVGVCDVL